MIDLDHDDPHFKANLEGHLPQQAQDTWAQADEGSVFQHPLSDASVLAADFKGGRVEEWVWDEVPDRCAQLAWGRSLNDSRFHDVAHSKEIARMRDPPPAEVGQEHQHLFAVCFESQTVVGELDDLAAKQVADSSWVGFAAHSPSRSAIRPGTNTWLTLIEGLCPLGGV